MLQVCQLRYFYMQRCTFSRSPTYSKSILGPQNVRPKYGPERRKNISESSKKSWFPIIERLLAPLASTKRYVENGVLQIIPRSIDWYKIAVVSIMFCSKKTSLNKKFQKSRFSTLRLKNMDYSIARRLRSNRLIFWFYNQLLMLFRSGYSILH